MERILRLTLFAILWTASFTTLEAYDGSDNLFFQTGDLLVRMKINPSKTVTDAVLRDRNRVIRGFTGVSKTIEYCLIPQVGTLPKNLKVKEVLEIVWQSNNVPFDVLDERERTVEVASNGSFSDLLALGTNNGASFPSQFRQIVRQTLYLVDPERYPTGRLLAILAIERRPTDILVKVLSPPINKIDRRFRDAELFVEERNLACDGTDAVRGGKSAGPPSWPRRQAPAVRLAPLP